MTIDEISSYCLVKNCTVTFGDSDVGFVHVDGTGVTGKFNNYRRFLMLNEMASLPDPRKVLIAATVFSIEFPEGSRRLSRDEFEAEVNRVKELVNS